MRILVIEDELDLCDAICDGLRIDGYAVDACHNGIDAYELLYVENYDLAILDLNLPKMNGLQVLSKIRQDKKDLKILILSARDSIDDKVTGLDLGANDYLAKPFDFAELEARIRSLLRRQFLQQDNLIHYHGIVMDFAKRTVHIHQQEVILTKKEYSIFEYFLLNKDKVISSEELIDHVWDGNVDSFSGAIRVHMSSLRKKLKQALGYDIIVTKIKEGFLLQPKNGVDHVS